MKTNDVDLVATNFKRIIASKKDQNYFPLIDADKNRRQGADSI